LAAFSCAKIRTKPIVLLASGTGFAPVKALIEHMQFKGITRPTTLYWGGRRPGDLYWTTGCKARWRELPQLRYVPGRVRCPARRRLDGPHRLCAPGGAARTLPTSRATRCMPVARPSWSNQCTRGLQRQRGLPAEEFFADSFTSEADKHGA
jgi:CDP-4-dehydro-6-deoxyglucose reductase